MTAHQSAFKTRVEKEIESCMQQIRKQQQEQSNLDPVEAEYQRQCERMAGLRVAINVRGSEREDAEYSAAEFIDDDAERRYREQQLGRQIRKDVRRRKRLAIKDQRRFGGPIHLWTFDEMKKGKATMKKDEKKAAATDVKEKNGKVKMHDKVKEKVKAKAEKETPKKEKAKDKEKKAKGKKTKADRGSSIADGKITLLTKENPKRQGSSAYKRFELYKKHKTVASYLAAGGKRSSLRYDEKHEYIKLSGVKTKAEMKEK